MVSTSRRRGWAALLAAAPLIGLGIVPLPVQAASGCNWNDGSNYPATVGISGSRANARLDVAIGLAAACPGPVSFGVQFANEGTGHPEYVESWMQSRSSSRPQVPNDPGGTVASSTSSSVSGAAVWTVDPGKTVTVHLPVTLGSRYWVYVHSEPTLSGGDHPINVELWRQIFVPRTDDSSQPADCGVAGAGGCVSHNPGDAKDPTLSDQAVGSVMDSVNRWFIDGAAGLVDVSWKLMSNATAVAEPDFSKPWFINHYAMIVYLATLLMLPFLIASVIYNVIRGNGTELAKCCLVYMPIAFIGVAILGWITSELTQVVDGWSKWIVQSDDQAVSDYISSLQAMIRGGGQPGGVAGPVAAIAGIVMILGALGVFIELVIREAAIYILVLLAPFLFAGMVWTWARAWVKKGLEFLVIMIFSKFLIVLVTSAGALAIIQGAGFKPTGGSPADLARQVRAGGVLLLAAASSVGALFRILPIVESGIADAAEHAQRRWTTSGSSAQVSAGGRSFGRLGTGTIGLGGSVPLRVAGMGAQALGSHMRGSDRTSLRWMGRMAGTAGLGISSFGRRLHNLGPIQASNPKPPPPEKRPLST